jgi:hypothetical protein
VNPPAILARDQARPDEAGRRQPLCDERGAHQHGSQDSESGTSTIKADQHATIAQPTPGHDREGREIEPMTVGQMRYHGVRSVEATCEACGHEARQRD